MKRTGTILLILAALLTVMGAAYYLGKTSSNSENSRVAVAEKEADKNNLVARRIFIEKPSDIVINFSELRQNIKDYFDSHKLSGSLYFEYLPTGTSIRINDDELNVAASLIKLPVAMELLKGVETGKVSLDTEVTLKPEWLDNEFGTLYEKGSGYKLTLGEANKIMLTQSDNTALKAIVNTIDGNIPLSQSPFNYLDTDAVQNRDSTVSISSKSYSSFLKCLYFSCYLTPEHSQYLLNLLTQSEFNDRLTAKLDGQVTVAHKIGNYFDQVQSDCGIFYVPNRNYVLCVMLDGPENTATDAHVAQMSLMTYNFVKSRQ